MADKSVITVSEMAAKCHFSRSRFYDLVAAGVFPAPITHPASKRPMYDRSLQEKCLEVCRSGIGINGQPVLFNKKPARGAKRARRPAKNGEVVEEVMVVMRNLNLSPTTEAVQGAIDARYPHGTDGVAVDELITNVLDHLTGNST